MVGHLRLVRQPDPGPLEQSRRTPRPVFAARRPKSRPLARRHAPAGAETNSGGATRLSTDDPRVAGSVAGLAEGRSPCVLFERPRRHHRRTTCLRRRRPGMAPVVRIFAHWTTGRLRHSADRALRDGGQPRGDALMAFIRIAATATGRMAAGQGGSSSGCPTRLRGFAGKRRQSDQPPPPRRETARLLR